MASFYRGITKLPFEVYPIFAMIGCAISFGTFVGFRKLAYDPTLRLPNRSEHDWQNQI